MGSQGTGEDLLERRQQVVERRRPEIRRPGRERRRGQRQQPPIMRLLGYCIQMHQR